MEHIIAVISVKTNKKYELEIEFADGVQKIISFLPYIKKGVSKELEDYRIFQTAKVDYGTVVWTNGYDVCPVFLRNC